MYKNVKLKTCLIHENENNEAEYLYNTQRNRFLKVNNSLLELDNLYGWKMSQKLPANCFKRVEDFSEFDEDFIKT